LITFATDLIAKVVFLYEKYPSKFRISEQRLRFIWG
jgi:hypothetical protein